MAEKRKVGWRFNDPGTVTPSADLRQHFVIHAAPFHGAAFFTHLFPPPFPWLRAATTLAP